MPKQTCWRIVALAGLLCLGLCPPAQTADLLESARVRFAAADVRETPDFRRHVVPLLGRLGCNGRACHGSFQGQGGFRLSLFGYDFRADHEALTGGKAPRASVRRPAESLMLHKPTHPDEHGGGRRLEIGSWQYNVLRRWIESGARGANYGDAGLPRLEVTPREVVFASAGQQVPLRISAYWPDGKAEDVTPL